MPPSSSTLPKAKRGIPVWGSVPTVPMASPKAAMASPLAREEPVKPITPARPSVPSAKVSGGPKLSAALDSSGASVITRTMEIVPATKEATAAMARAGPARPLRAIW